MISIEEKLSVFEQYLIKKQQDTQKDTLEVSRKNREAQLLTAKNRLEDEKRSIEEHSYHVIFRDKNKIIADGKNRAKDLTLSTKKAIINDFNKTLLKRSKNFVGSQIYENYLIRVINEIPMAFNESTKKLIAYSLPSDRDFVKQTFQRFLPDYQCEYRDLNANKQCGIIVTDEEETFFCDMSIEKLVEDNQKKIGLMLMQLIAETEVKE